MKAILELELIGDDLYQTRHLINRGVPVRLSPEMERRVFQFGQPQLRPWVARVTAWGFFGPTERTFLRAHTKDYRHANGTGSRGVMAYYVLEDGIYEVNERTSWKKARRYLLRVIGGIKREITAEEAAACLPNEA